MKTNKANDPHPVYVSLRDWSKTRIHVNTVAKKTERIPSLSTKQTEIKCTRQVYILPH